MFGSKEPGKEKKRATWSIPKWKDGGTFYGWIAGRMVGVYVHFVKASKPCYWEITDEKLECPYCRIMPVPDWRGYLPLYDESGTPMCVQIHPDMRPQIAELLLHAAVKVTKGKGKYDKVIVKADGWSGRYRPGNSGRHIGADVRPWLIHTLWKEQPLIDYFKEHTPAPLEPLQLVPEPNEMSPMYQAAAKRAAKPGGIAEEFARRGKLPPTQEPKLIGDVLPILNGKLHRKD